MTSMDETWDVPNDHFTDKVLTHHLCYLQGLTEDERFYVRCRGNWAPDISDGAFDVPSGDHGFHGWNPKCIPTIYYINWKIEQERMIRERGTKPVFVEKKTSSDLRREAGEKRRREGIKENYDRPKKKYVYKK